MFTFLALVNSTEDGHLCRPPQMGAFLWFFLLLFYYFFFLINPRMCCIGWLDKTGSQRGLMGVLYWATKEDGKQEGKEGVSCWYRGDNHLKRKELNKKGWLVTKEERAVGDKESMFCKLAGDFRKKDLFIYLFFWEGVIEGRFWEDTNWGHMGGNRRKL